MANPIKIKTIVNNIVKYDENVFVVDFLTEGMFPKFKAGQFLHLALDDYDPYGGFWPESRVFSIASGYNRNKIKIVYSVKGYFTKRMRNELKVGKEVWLKLPYGNFIIDIHKKQDLILIAGGTGISPFIPFLENTYRDDVISRKVYLAYGVKKPELIIFNNLLVQSIKSNNLYISLYIESKHDGVSGFPKELIETGIIDIDRVYKESLNYNDPEYYLSGPPAMIDSFKKRLIELGVIKSNIIIDEWE